MEKKIQIATGSEDLEIYIRITEEMIRDHRECKEKACAIDGEKDCKTCSWDKACFADVCMCELEYIEDVIEHWEVPDEQ